MQEIGATMFQIPARFPDLNPIENTFQLHEVAIDQGITKESFQEF